MVELGMDPIDCLQENIGGGPSLTELNGVKESIHNNVKETGSVGRGLQNSTEQMPSLKFPKAVVAFAQVAAKVNGEPEKCMSVSCIGYLLRSCLLGPCLA